MAAPSRADPSNVVDAGKAQGCAPIACALGQAANDFLADAQERVIVLVSDGKETCHGDPVVAAKALTISGANHHTSAIRQRDPS